VFDIILARAYVLYMFEQMELNAQQLLRDAYIFSRSYIQKFTIIKYEYIKSHISLIEPRLLSRYSDRFRAGEPEFDSR
jgi:hypothetical protein